MVFESKFAISFFKIIVIGICLYSQNIVELGFLHHCSSFLFQNHTTILIRGYIFNS